MHTLLPSPMQRAAVRRMVALEAGSFSGRADVGAHWSREAPPLSHPFIRRLVTQNGLLIYANMVSTHDCLLSWVGQPSCKVPGSLGPPALPVMARQAGDDK